MKDFKIQASIEAEQSLLGALLIDNDAIDRIPDLQNEHFYKEEHRAIFVEIKRQIAKGSTCDVISVYEELRDKYMDILPYLNSIATNTPSSANIKRYAGIIEDKALKRGLITIGLELQDLANESHLEAVEIADKFASRIESSIQRKAHSDPIKLVDGLSKYVDLLTRRMSGEIKPIKTGFHDLDRRLDGGLERGTLTVIAARPAMGKTAMALALCRNVAEWGTSLFLSMEMSEDQINDRNIGALGHIPISWLKNPTDTNADDKLKWDSLTVAFAKSQELNLHNDYETSLNMLEIRSKARKTKRKFGLDIMVIDQLSFITGSENTNKSYELGEYTRGCIAIAKELDIAIVLLCQLNRDCEKRQNRRPNLSDLSSSGSIEQDAANVLFLYRDEIYNPNTRDKGVCEVISSKQRQGEPGIVGLAYFGSETRFENLKYAWNPQEQQTARRGAAEHL